jgi:hypothetical protein
MRAYTPKEKAKITAGAVASLVIVAWLAVLAIGHSLSAIKGPPTRPVETNNMALTEYGRSAALGFPWMGRERRQGSGQKTKNRLCLTRTAFRVAQSGEWLLRLSHRKPR